MTVDVPRRFDLDRAWRMHSQVAIRPERFGALAYHFGTRRLSFLKSRKLLAVVQALADHPSGREACRRAGVSDAELPAYERALQTLAASGMVIERGGQ
ncbi:MAG TPA: mycofactocin biosynthesis chaperone MftB [Solirubrobacteraceae bacterium]|jgi:putative mycofactocin binding protein MftB